MKAVGAATGAISGASKQALIVALAAVLALALAACGGDDDDDTEAVVPPEERTAEGEAPTADELVGIWWASDPEIFGGVILVRFSPDGTFAKDWRGLLDTSPAAAGTYELDGAAITFASSRSDVCTEGDQWAWDAGIPEEGRLILVWTESPADECFVGPGSQWSLTRVSPSSPASAEIAGEPGEDPVPPQDETTVAGIWLLEGTGRLLRLGEDRSYATDEAGALGVDPADGGRFQLDDGTITFTSGEGSNACAQGDEWVWERAEVAVSPQLRPDPEAGEGGLAQPGDWTLQAEVTEDGCGHAVGDEPRWLRLSP